MDYLPDVIKVVFPADEFGPLVNDVHTPIVLIDDNMDEAVEELFVAVLTLENAVHPDNAVIGRSSSICRINDNDGRCQSSISFSVYLVHCLSAYACDAFVELIMFLSSTHTPTCNIIVLLNLSLYV